MGFMDRAIIHVDMDAFYASVEQRDNPSLRGKPVIVGGHPTRGVVLAASYEVRPFGVRSAMPMSRAVKMAPAAIVVSPRFEAYVEASEKVFSIFEAFTPLIEPLSLDEAFLDVSASQTLFGAPGDMAREIRRRIREETGLPASAGISAVKFVAKIASDLGKPDGQKEVPPSETLDFLWALPVWRLWGVGAKTEAQLKVLGLNTVGQVAKAGLPFLEEKLGSSGAHLHALSMGQDDRTVVVDRGAKSIGAEDTFEEDLHGAEMLEPYIHAQALRVGRRLRRTAMATRVVQLKLKTADFKLITRRKTLLAPTDDGQTIYGVARELLHANVGQAAYRLTGVSAQDLQDGGAQLPLFDQKVRRAKRLNAAMDAIQTRFGHTAVTTADLAGRSDRDGDELRRKAGGSVLDPGED